MKKRPLSTRIIAIIYFVSPLMVLMYFFIRGAEFRTMDWGLFALTVTAPVVGYGVWTIRNWGYVLLLVHSILIIINNILIMFSGAHDVRFYLATIVSGLLLGIIILFVRKEVMTPYFNPKVRWWESAARYYYPNMKVLVKEHNSDKLLFEAQSFDLSETGVFVTTDRKMNVGEKYSFELILANNSILYTDGEVVWVNPAKKSMFPMGFGCWFSEPNGLFRKRIRYHLRDIRAKMREIRTPR